MSTAQQRVMDLKERVFGLFVIRRNSEQNEYCVTFKQTCIYALHRKENGQKYQMQKKPRLISHSITAPFIHWRCSR